MGIITFYSDFGRQDGYVGAVKGAILSLNPRANIVDISHEGNAYDVRSAAYNLLSYYSQFPRNTVHLAVVDPGVGGKRDPIIVRTSNYMFVGPDNGLFSLILENEAYSAYVIDPLQLRKIPGYQRGQGNTFHARDIFGPVAALLARGENIQRLITRVTSRIQLLTIDVQRKENHIRTEILSFDRFGNIITNLKKQYLTDIKKTGIAEVRYKTYIFDKLSETYSSVAAGEPLALWGSSGFLEIAVNQGDAVQFFKSERTDFLEIILK